ncbi:hypothetical protein QBC37DRAFT_280853 [Rhypophila decipiens]|uniref:Uncharacterized protein n=1 Tax=Rhypophila decipiens TaxID=261697 RepID=A0AAN7B9U8_9PEZI|nr:hypothetical protein QBC37DRAFT_280853 [Rhypophila decipiens]
MDGSYGNVFPNNSPMSPMTASSSGGDAYKVNVGRTKTKKWANFKPQNYDGDDWGTDYDDDGHEEPPPVPKPLGPRQQVPAPPHLRQFQPSGAPPLQTLTQQPAKPSETGSPAATGSSVYSPGPGFAQGGSGSGGGTPLRRVSPAPPSAGPQSVPSRFPPRKSSMGQSDAPDTAELMRQSQPNTSSSRPGSSHKPWVQPPSSSPGSARSPVSPSSGKPLPFIRPADIYRRMEEEKEKERRSIESSRHSSRPSLPPVAERKSEYGLDGLLASYGYGSDPARVEPAPAPDYTSSNLESVPAVQSAAGLRRLSTSPKLPDLGRISTFGDDLFYSSVFAAGAPSPLPVIQDSPPPSASEQMPSPSAPMAPMAPSVSSDNDFPTSGPEIAAPSANAQPTDSLIPGPGKTPSKASSEQGDLTLDSKPDQDSPDSSFSDQTTPSGPPPVVPAPSTVEKVGKPSRPSLPGAWVSETPTTAEDLPTPTPGEPSERLSTQDTTIDNSNNPTPLASPHNLPPLRTGSPAVSLSRRESNEGDQAEKGGSKSPSSAESSGTPQLTSPVPNTASTTAHSDIPPTAPLNPSRSIQEGLNSEDQEVNIAVPALDAGSTLDTTGGSPLKESDLLREEIIKSLSPIQAPSGFAETPGLSTAAYRSAASPVRESSYLAGVYDDYWGAGDDNLKSELQLETPALKEQGPEKPNNSQDTKNIPPVPTYAAPVPNTSAPVETASSPQEQVDSNARQHALRQRFSWEAEPEVIASPASASQAEPHPVVVETAAAPAAAAPAAPGPPTTVDAGHLAPAAPKTDLSPSSEPLGAGGISHQVSGASTIPPGSNLDAPIEPPSPVSVLSDKVGPATQLRRLSLAEEKAGAQSSSHPVSPTPPLEEHPAMAASANTALPAPPVKLMSFKQILEVPSAEERIKKFSETRAEFAQIDTGLEEWLERMVNESPEYANATSSFKDLAFRPATGHQGSAQNPGQGPLSQNMAESGLAHGTIPMPPPPHGSGHHHNQVGAKSKEILAMAGKKSKGLFSKGRNKLRGTGEKVFS